MQSRRRVAERPGHAAPPGGSRAVGKPGPARWGAGGGGARGADGVIESVGNPETWSLSVAMVRKGGRVCLFGGCAAGAKVELETHRIHYNEIALFGVFHHRPSYVRQAIELLGNGAVPTELLIGGRISLEDLVSFFAENRDTNALKAAVIL